ncbi:MAG: type II toxin-antitoxin system HicB family antitoxin [Deltaproteobacteria bacterium]|nr:type II toxin-antitoxin system HicB family antitoxin [Deltaproteobacteria bacterium]
MLVLEPVAEGGYFVSSPSDPALLTQGATIEECIENARDAAAALAASRRKLARQQARGSTAKPRRAA